MGKSSCQIVCPSRKTADFPTSCRRLGRLRGGGDRRIPGLLSDGVVVRVSAHLLGPRSENGKESAKAKDGEVPREKSFDEAWEFTPNQVYRVVWEHKNDKSIYHRVESRPFDSRGLCKDLLDGKALEIKDRKGTNAELMFAGADYTLGCCSIEILRNGETILDLREACVFAGYRETDARAFAALYERLASQASVLFKSKTGEAK